MSISPVSLSRTSLPLDFATKRLRGVNSRSAAVAVFSNSPLIRLPHAIAVLAFSFLSIENLINSRTICRAIEPISFFATTHYVFSSKTKKKLTYDHFKHHISRDGVDNLHNIWAIDLSGTDEKETTKILLKTIFVKKMAALKTLKFPVGFKENVLDFVTQNCPNLTDLGFEGLNFLSDQNLSKLVLPQLLCLDLSKTEILNAQGAPLKQIVESLFRLSVNIPQLQRLSLFGCKGGNVLPYLKFPELLELNLAGMDALTTMKGEEMSEAMKALSTHCRKLISLNIAGNVKEYSVLSLSEMKFPSLKRLNLSGWHLFEGSIRDIRMAQDALDDLTENCPLIDSLNLTGSLSSTQTLVVVGRLRHLTTLSFSSMVSYGMSSGGPTPFSKLTELNFIDDARFLDAGLQFICKQALKIKKLNLFSLKGTPLILTPLSLSRFAFPEVTDLRADFVGALEELRKSFPKLESINNC